MFVSIARRMSLTDVAFAPFNADRAFVLVVTVLKTQRTVLASNVELDTRFPLEILINKF